MGASVACGTPAYPSERPGGCHHRRNHPRRAARLSVLPATALRGDVAPERVSAVGFLILREGEPGEPEMTLSPLRYR